MVSSNKLYQKWWPRLERASRDEVQTRLVQEVAKRCDLALHWLGVSFEADHLNEFRQPSAQFFFSPEEIPELVSFLKKRFATDVEQILERAERICRHRFDLLGYNGLEYGPRIDWHLEPVHGKHTALKPWFKVRYLDFDEVGDHKVVWELSRHQHLLTLAKAYLLTREERYAAELIRQWYDWRQSNPYPLGINWVSSLEMAFRSLSWLWIRHLLERQPVVSEDFRRDLLRGLGLHARHISRYLSTYFSPNTHLLGEAVGLFFIGTLCPELPSAQRWQRQGWETILREAERQVQADGMHFEQSLYYHVYALDFFLHARTLAARNHIPIPEAFDCILLKMLDILARLGQAGTPPSFGDDDGGRVFDPRRDLPKHLLDPLVLGAAIFGRADLKSAVSDLTEEAVWLLGRRGIAQFEELPPARLWAKSVRFETSGICLMAGSQPKPYQLMIDAGHQGFGTAGHGHADALNLQLIVAGDAWLVDPGTFCYVSPGSERHRFRATRAHNTLEVDGTDQAEATGPFSWQSLPEVRVEQWVSGDTFDLFQGSHTGYCRLPEPVLHRRWVFNLKSRFFVVCDCAQGQGKHQLALSWCLAPGFRFSTRGPDFVGSHGSDSDCLAFVPVQDHRWSHQIATTRVSHVYGKSRLALVLRFVAHSDLPLEFAVVIARLEKLSQAGEAVGEFTRLGEDCDKPAVRGYRYDCHGERHYIFFAERGKHWSCGPWVSDARFLYCGLGPGDTQHWVLCEGGYVELAGRRLIDCGSVVAHCELKGRGAVNRALCSDESALIQLPNRLSAAEILYILVESGGWNGGFTESCAESAE